MLLARRTSPAASTSVRSVAAVAALVWAAFLLGVYLLSAADTLGAGGFVGAREARDEVLVILASTAFALSATAFVGTADQRVVTPFALALAVVVAGELAISSGRLVDALVALLLLGLAWSTGETLLRLLGLSGMSTSRLAYAALGTGTGLGALSFAVLLVALLGWLTDPAIAAILVAGASTLVIRLRYARRGWNGVSSAARGFDFSELTALVTLSAAAVIGFAVCLTPQTAFDALHYHLAMPLFFLEEQRFVERPDIIQGYFPLGLEMVYVPAFRLGGEATANLLHWAFAPLTAVLVWSAADRLFGRPAGALAAVLFGAMPLVIWESTATTSDLPLTFFIVAAVSVLYINDGLDARRCFAAGLFAGMALSFKIVAALYIVPVVVVFGVAFWLARRRTEDAGVRPLLAFAAGGLLTGAPWLLLRWLQTGNPMLPLFNNVFRSDLWPPVNERFDLDQFGIGTGPADFVSFWWQASADPSRFGQATPDWLIGLPLLASLGALIFARELWRAPEGRLWALAAILSLLAWFGFSQYLRYGLPAFALLAPLAAGAIVGALRSLRLPAATASGLLSGFIALLFAAGIVIATGAFSLTPGHFPTAVLLGRESAAGYRRDWVPNYTAISFFAAATQGQPDKGVILGFPYNYFAANELYDVIVPATLSPFRRVVEAGLPLAEMARALLEEDVRWFIYDANNPFEHEEWPPVWLANSILSPVFVANHLHVAFSEDGVTVYRIVESK